MINAFPTMSAPTLHFCQAARVWDDCTTKIVQAEHNSKFIGVFFSAPYSHHIRTIFG